MKEKNYTIPDQLSFEEYLYIMGQEWEKPILEAESEFYVRINFGGKLEEVLRGRGVTVTDAAKKQSGVREFIRNVKLPSSVATKRLMATYRYVTLYSFGTKEQSCGKWYTSIGVMFADALTVRGLTATDFIARATEYGIATSGVYGLMKNKFVSEYKVNQWLGVMGYYLHMKIVPSNPLEMQEYFKGLAYVARSQQIYDTTVEEIVASDDYSIGKIDVVGGLPKRKRKAVSPEKLQAKVNKLEYGKLDASEVIAVMEKEELRVQAEVLKLPLEPLEIFLKFAGNRLRYTVDIQNTQTGKPVRINYYSFREMVQDTARRVYGDAWESLLSKTAQSAYKGLSVMRLNGLAAYASALNLGIKLSIVK